MSQILQRARTPEQQAVVQRLVQEFGIDAEKVLFLKKGKPLEPWLNYKALTRVAKLSGRFRGLAEHFATYVEPLRQVVHSATVTDKDGFEYTRSGSATIGEQLFDGDEANADELAASRALRAALDAADFDPVNAGAQPLDLQLSAPEHVVADSAISRANDIKAAHKIARDKGLIRPSPDDASLLDMTDYRAFLTQGFNVNSMVGLKPYERAALINALRELPDPIQPASTDVAN
jgi:hypothetical protein